MHYSGPRAGEAHRKQAPRLNMTSDFIAAAEPIRKTVQTNALNPRCLSTLARLPRHAQRWLICAASECEMAKKLMVLNENTGW